MANIWNFAASGFLTRGSSEKQSLQVSFRASDSKPSSPHKNERIQSAILDLHGEKNTRKKVPHQSTWRGGKGIAILGILKHPKRPSTGDSPRNRLESTRQKVAAIEQNFFNPGVEIVATSRRTHERYRRDSQRVVVNQTGTRPMSLMGVTRMKEWLSDWHRLQQRKRALRKPRILGAIVDLGNIIQQASQRPPKEEVG